jgi:murein DD-endopeptidase MepM/ murein hydrolase activator NlpD
MDQETLAQASTSNETIAAQEAASTAQASEAASAAEAQSSQSQQAVDAPAWTPDYKFKVMDEEKEVDELLRPAITDQEKQAKIKELYEKAYGLDHVKAKREQLEKEYNDYKGQTAPVLDNLKQVGAYLKNKDFGSFFNTFKLTDEDILQYAIKRLEYLEADPAKRQLIEAQEQEKTRLAQTSLENEQLREWKKQQETNAFVNEFQATLSKPDYSSISQQFDARAGTQGAFRNAVIMHGQTLSRQAGRTIPVEEVVQNLVQTYGLSQMASQPSPAQTAATGSSDSSQRKDTLPKIKSTGSSPVASKVKSISDLKKLQQQVYDTGR